jgi:Zn-dependent peptidase ImmA (M78 family)
MVRKAWHVPTGPIVHLVRTLETRGIVLTQLPAVDSETIDAFSAALHGRPMIVLSNKGNPMRQRFSVAHELGHLLLHPHPAPGSHVHEREANTFAAEFLMPAAEIRDRLPTPVDIPTLKETADGYGESTLRRTMAALNRLGWRTDEPVGSRYPGERPELLPRAAELAADHGLPLPLLADKLRLGVPRLRELLGLPDPRPRLRLVPNDV